MAKSETPNTDKPESSASASEGEKFDFRKLLNKDQLDALKASTPEFLKKIFSDDSVLEDFSTPDLPDLKEFEAEEPVTPEVPDIAKVAAGIFNKFKGALADPKQALNDLNPTIEKAKRGIELGKEKAEAKLKAAKTYLSELQEKQQAEIKAAAQLQEAIDTLKTQLPTNSGLVKTIEKLEKKLSHHRQVVFLQQGAINQLKQIQKIYRAIRSAFPKN